MAAFIGKSRHTANYKPQMDTLRKYGLAFSCGFMVVACQPSEGDSSAAYLPNVTEVIELEGTKWDLVELVSADSFIPNARPANQGEYQLDLNADGTANLKLDCNRANGPWAAVKSGGGNSGVFNIGPAAMTRAMCRPDSLDQRIARELKYIRSYVVKDGQLNLQLLNGGSQIWAPRQGPET